MISRANDGVDRPGAAPAEGTSALIKEYVASHKSGIGRLVMGVFEIQTLQEAERLSTMLATHCPDPENVAVGIWELLSNAIEHGNLEISFDEKTKLLKSGTFANEVNRRIKLAQYAKRIVRVEFERTENAIRLTVLDEGRGFDFASFMKKDAIPERPNGRGIQIAAKTCFDRLTYRGCGNVVEAAIELGRAD
jgi:anti-sigma regulatory factor (Ser/Thr protein kinase)